MTLWKKVELAIAKRFGSVRSGPTGRMGPDVVHSLYAIEIKHRKQLPAWMLKAMYQAVRNAKDGTLPMVIWHEKGRHHGNDLVMLRLKDFETWFGNGPTARGNDETQSSEPDQ